jgi:hypothetical protein
MEPEVEATKYAKNLLVLAPNILKLPSYPGTGRWLPQLKRQGLN